MKHLLIILSFLLLPISVFGIEWTVMYDMRESDGSYREYMKLTPKEREIQYAKVDRKEDVFEREEGIYRTRRLKTEGLRIGSEFRSALTLEINRYMKDYQQILNGVAQGIYRKQIKF